MTNKYDIAFKRFVGDSEDPEWTRKPNRRGEYIIATDRYILIRIDASKCADGYSCHEKFPETVDCVFPKANCNLELGVLEVAKLINGIPEESTITVSGEDAKCPECHGRRTVTWEYESRNGTEYGEFDCPECNGYGYVKHKLLARPERNIEINGAKFIVGHLMDVLESIYQLGHTSAKVVSLSNTQPMMITPEPGVDIIIMPNQLSDVACSYTLKSLT